MMKLLEDTARSRGYTFVTRDARVGNGYADKIAQNYRERIVESHEKTTAFGPQRYFKIRL
ncbi:hypothetical protein COU19_03035 [Candidatus Kaiserbacteria bacterium CG10_big_fil_rev_8_21_14_0_10_56_12]|uniref:Uncharacterized protein n=1 Tax=Candidatus Kaiserbacteria bacterium CG10_big_fil_rev_8_21_14_0_10_56_12 TaxID=1974611 RepID=A0A2H0U966_9BACT|nr:MAG: hypothetical protein COU19_03035 [Candidatus Kaiserbacteria bacterium CG10_big_fil_rev_8_21_14_0_10_56_12]